MAKKFPTVEVRHLGCAIAIGCAIGAVSNFAAAMVVHERFSDFLPEETGTVASRYREPVDGWGWHLGAALFFGAGLAAVATVPIGGKDGEPALRLDSIGTDMGETLAIGRAITVVALNLAARQGLKPLWKKSAPVRAITVRAIPTPIRDRAAQIHDTTEWLETLLESRRVRITGTPGSGKSFFSLRALMRDVERYPAARVAICDINYGKPKRSRRGGELNPRTLTDWNGYPGQAIYSSPWQIFGVVETFRDEMERRKSACEKAARAGTKPDIELTEQILYVDELDRTIAIARAANTQASKDKLPPDNAFEENLNALMVEGDGYGMRLRLIGQSLAVNQSGISEAQNAMCSVLVLGENVDNATEVGKLKASNSKELQQRANQLRSRGKFAAIAQTRTGVFAVEVPDLSWVETVRFTTATGDPDADWWASVCTPDFEAATTAHIQRYLASPETGSPLKAIAASVGLQTRLDNRRYAEFFKPWYDALMATRLSPPPQQNES